MEVPTFASVYQKKRVPPQSFILEYMDVKELHMKENQDSKYIEVRGAYPLNPFSTYVPT